MTTATDEQKQTFYGTWSPESALELLGNPDYDTTKYTVVKCYRINNTQLHYECPFCYQVQGRTNFSRCSKKGVPYKTLKPTYHRHGSGGDNSNRIEIREPHCCAKEEWAETSDDIKRQASKPIMLVVGDETIRG